MPKPLRMGVSGAGSIGIRAALMHLSQDDVKDEVVLGAVCDPFPGRAKAAAEKYEVPQWFENYEDMLRKGDIDAVTICSPIGIHYEQGMKAVKAGKHLHFNKTMTTTRREADKLIAEAASRNVKIVASPGQMLRPQNLRIRKLIKEGAIGLLAWAVTGGSFGDYHETEDVRTGEDVLTNIDPSWYFRKPGGGPLYDITVYGLHTLTGVLGPAKRVTAMSNVVLKEREFKGRRVPCDADDNTLMLLDFGNSALAFVHGTPSGWLSSLHFPQYFGTKGTIKGTELNGNPIEYPGRERDKGGWGGTLTPHVKGRHAEMGEVHVYEDMMQLVDWVREGKPSPANAEHARHVIEIIEEAFASARTGKARNLSTSFTPPEGV